MLSGFYGILRPLDGVVSYRLEMNNPFKMAGYSSLYQVWGDKIYQELIKDDHEILDLGANQYARVIKKYLSKPVKYVKCYFKEEIDSQLKEIGVYVKMARGAMTRYIVKNRITTYEGVKLFNDLNYQYQEDLSSSEAFVFVRKSEKF
ncbi:peroxide stress protein YaaA [Coprobacillaceae bacterium CR2/5/TPMF4]|nr:peroxide stress protein YaaA [Coprobacillaceae bacterium CR2/5/TPMF4]